MQNKRFFIIVISFLIFIPSLFAAEAPDKIGVFIFSSREFADSGKEFAASLEKNGLDARAISTYLESQKFGFDDFNKCVRESSSDLGTVMMIFNFHGLDAKECHACEPSENCLQGNLCALEEKFISAQQIRDDLLLPLAGKKIVIFFKSCFSGHLAKKVQDVAKLVAWEKSTPIALVATDNNALTSTIGFLFPKYMRNATLFTHWKNIEQAQRYEKMVNFEDFVSFVNNEKNTGFTFSFFSINNGSNIQLADMGFKNTSLRPSAEIQDIENLYEKIEKKIAHIDLSKLIILLVETRRNYEFIFDGDPWLNAFKEKGVAIDRIHWLREKKIGHETTNSQVHLFQDGLDFITPENNVIVLVRGDDSYSSQIFPHSWSLDLDGLNSLSAETIINNIFPKLKHAQRVLLVLVSTHSDFALEHVVKMSRNKVPDNLALVSFYSSDRTNNYSSYRSWPWGYLAPLYHNGNYKYYCSIKYQSDFPDMGEKRSLAIQGLEAFASLENFEDYLFFLNKAAAIIYDDICIKTHNTHSQDLDIFGFLPPKMPEIWRGW